MTTPIEKRNASKFYEFHGEERPGKGSKKGETSGKDKLLVILMVQPWQKVAKQRITQTFSPKSVISFPSLGEEDGTEGPMIIEAEMGGHFVHRMYMDGGSFSEILYEHCLNRFCPEVKNHMVPATMPLVAIPIQQNHRKARSKENTSSSVYSSLNAKIPSNRRNSYITEQQDYSIRMHNGFRTRSVAARCLPVRQKKKGQAPKRNKAIYEEVEKLVDAGIMKEVNYHSWLSNSVMIKNVGATYERLVDKAFQKQIGQNLKVYVDDLVIKSRTEQEVIRDIEKNFKTLKEINMKLNPKKCTFGMREGMFLGYKVNADGLKVCPDKVEAVLSLPSPKCLKDVQRLNGKLASLNRFLSKSTKKSLPFFKTLKKCTKKSDFQWTAEAETAFRQMKILIAKLPMLTTPKEKEELVIYLAAAKEAIGEVLMTKRDEKQMPIYFVSHTLQGLEINYTPMEKLILALTLQEDCSNEGLS
ncbi:reverse transcriptase domain-containing protein [Tanacetum coccineum]